jgi:sugar-specific transcriptional regulator TrmB
MLNEVLEDIGLSKRESKSYLALLELGSSKVGAITKKTGIPSSKIYEVLDRLVKRGFVSYIIRGKIKYYQASDPKILLTYISEKKKRIDEILPKLIEKQKLTTRQSVEVFEGQKAVFSMFWDLVADARPNEPYLIFSINEENKSESANLFLKNLALRRKTKRLDVKLLRNISYYQKEKHTKLQLRYTEFNLPQGITIFRNYVILLSWIDSPLAIRIESDIFASQLKEFFMDLWKIAKR